VNDVVIPNRGSYLTGGANSFFVSVVLECVKRHQARSLLCGGKKLGNMSYDHFPQFNPTYKARIAEEEDKLRWLVARHPSNRELSYYLIFLLAANEQYAKAIEECRRVLQIHPNDMVARMWTELIRIRWQHPVCRRVSRCTSDRARGWRRFPHRA
jgi:hypothetical protein